MANLTFVHHLTNETRDAIQGLPIDDSFSPLLHRLDSAIRYRAVHPEDPILEPSDRLIEFSHPPEDMIKRSQPYLTKLISTADVKKGIRSPLYLKSDRASLTNLRCSSPKSKGSQTPTRNRETPLWSRRRRASHT